MSAVAVSTPFGGVSVSPIVLGVTAAALLGAAAFALYKVYGLIQDPNKGTAYEGNGSILTVPGAVATLGNVTNQVLGGLPQTAGEAIGSGLYDFFHPSEGGASVTYVFTFPDGSKGAVNNTDVDGAGNFTYTGSNPAWKGRNLQLLTAQDGSHTAVTP